MRPKSFFVNGGASRMICSIPAFEKYQEEHPDEDFVIVCEGGSDFSGDTLRTARFDTGTRTCSRIN